MTNAKRTNRKQFALDDKTLHELEAMATYAKVSENEIIHRAIDIAYEDCVDFDPRFREFVEAT